MFQRTVLFSISALLACSGEKENDSEDTQAEDVSIEFALTYVDAATAGALVGAEVCVLEPEGFGEESCVTTDENGVIEVTWMEPVETDFLSRLTMDDYFTALYTGRYDDALGAAWEELFEETGVVEFTYVAWSDSVVDLAFQLAGTAHQDGMGHVAFGLVGADATSMEGATVVLTNEDGESVGEVLYVNALGTAFDATLESTSIAGGTGIVNVAPGTYTFTVTSSDFSCAEGFSWHTDVTNSVTLPVEANSMTMGRLSCTAL